MQWEHLKGHGWTKLDIIFLLWKLQTRISLLFYTHYYDYKILMCWFFLFNFVIMVMTCLYVAKYVQVYLGAEHQRWTPCIKYPEYIFNASCIFVQEHFNVLILIDCMQLYGHTKSELPYIAKYIMRLSKQSPLMKHEFHFIK